MLLPNSCSSCYKISLSHLPPTKHTHTLSLSLSLSPKFPPIFRDPCTGIQACTTCKPQKTNSPPTANTEYEVTDWTSTLEMKNLWMQIPGYSSKTWTPIQNKNHWCRVAGTHCWLLWLGNEPTQREQQTKRRGTFCNVNKAYEKYQGSWTALYLKLQFDQYLI
jgi:hypothetical protein